MRLPLLLISMLFIVGLLVDWYIYRVVSTRSNKHRQLWQRVAGISSALCAIALIAIYIWPKKSTSDNSIINLMWGLYAYASVYIPKYLYVIIDMLSRLPQLVGFKRIKSLSLAGVALSLLAFGAMWWGALVNRFSIDVNEVDFADSRVPEAFDGFKIVQISDIHSGTFGNDTGFLSDVVEKVNELQPDIILFTGDIVNRQSSELEPFTGVLSRLRAPHGVVSILGNHDYGDYRRWADNADKEADLEHLKQMQRSMNWTMLNDSTLFLTRGDDTMAIVGVENIGDPPYRVYGDLDEAYPGDLADPIFKILMSHNPAHWTSDIAESPDKNIALTLSGHTHAMQFSIFGLSPAVYVYDTWSGRYDDSDGSHTLYVNIGLGEVGIPSRIGATPEVTLITLHRR